MLVQITKRDVLKYKVGETYEVDYGMGIYLIKRKLAKEVIEIKEEKPAIENKELKIKKVTKKKK
jgi:hypothetical protein